MDLISHIIFGIIFSKNLSLLAIFGAVFPDLDRLYSYPKKRFFSYSSRTWWHELPFLSFVMLIGIVLGLYPFVLGVVSHIFLDFVTGSTRPFYPFSKKIIDFNLSKKVKIVLGGIIWVIGAVFIANSMGFLV